MLHSNLYHWVRASSFALNNSITSENIELHVYFTNKPKVRLRHHLILTNQQNPVRPYGRAWLGLASVGLAQMGLGLEAQASTSLTYI